MMRVYPCPALRCPALPTCQVLLWLAYAHANGGEPTSCLSCLETLAQAGSELLDMPEVAALRIR
jgi:hypothetical protein